MVPHSQSGVSLSLYATLSLGSYLISVCHTLTRELPYLCMPHSHSGVTLSLYATLSFGSCLISVLVGSYLISVLIGSCLITQNGCSMHSRDVEPVVAAMVTLLFTHGVRL